MRSTNLNVPDSPVLQGISGILEKLFETVVFSAIVRVGVTYIPILFKLLFGV